MHKNLFVGLTIMCVMLIGLIAPAAAANPVAPPHQDEGALPLDAIYTSEFSPFEIGYPSAWEAMTLGPTEAVIADPDQAIIVNLVWGESDLIAGADTPDVLGVLLYYFQHNDIMTPEAPHRDTLGDANIAFAEGGLGGTIHFYMAFPNGAEGGEGEVGGINATVLAGELADFRPTLLAMVTSALPGEADEPPDLQPDGDPTEGALPLSASYTYNRYSFSHPSGWTTEYHMSEPGLSSLILGSSDDVATNGGFFYDFQPGDVYVDFSWEALGNFSGVDGSSSPVDVLDASIIGYYPDMGDAYEIEVGGHTFGVAEGVHEAGLPMMAVFGFWDEETVVWFLSLMAPGEYEQNRPTLLAIAASAIPAGALGAVALPDTAPDSESDGGPTLGQGALSEAVPDVASAPAVPTSIDGPADCHNVAVSIGEYSSAYSADYLPDYLLDGDPATGWSSSGGAVVEFVEVNLDGLQPVYGVLFNSYSTSAGWESDSINEFAIEATLSDGSTRAIFKGQAALVEGYQSYLFDPVETDQLRFIFSSTHGGGYYEAADLMVCALEGVAQGMPLAPEEPLIRQWASRATATSQYADSDWSAAQATGEPDTPGCGDYSTAWASLEADGVDVLTVFFDTPVIPTRIHIYQTYNPGAIRSVELVFGPGDPSLPIPNSADNITGCPGTFTVDVPPGFTDGRPVIGVIIRLDQRSHTGWNEIDAVELVGTAP